MARRSRLEKIGSRWGNSSQKRAHDSLQGWLDSPLILESFVQPAVSDSPKVDWLTGAVERLRIPPGGHWLSIGCGSANTEIHAARTGLFDSMAAFDVSGVSLEHAKAAAEKAGVTGIEFRAADLDHLRLPRERFDVVLAIMSLHHVRRIGPLLEEIRGTLKPGGLLLTNEYVGPRRHQFTDRQLSIARELLEALPDVWRRDGETGSIKTEAGRLSVREWKRVDPSEGVRSDRILPEIEKRFRIVDRRDYGGAILHPMLEGIVHNFDPGDPKDVGAIRLIGAFENILVRLGAIPSDFTVIAAEKRTWVPRKLAALPIVGRLFRGPELETIVRPLPPPTPRSYADFQRSAHASEIVSGFHPREGGSRWLGESGEIRLRVAAEHLNFLVGVNAAALGDRPFRVDVTLRPEGETETIDLGSLSLDEPGLQEKVLPLGESLYGRLRNRTVDVLLRTDRTWVPANVIPGSADERSLSVQIFRIAFER